MRGNNDDELVSACACTIRVPTASGEEIALPGVVSGSRLTILCDEYPLQSWISEHKQVVLQAVAQTFGVKLRECKIYADTHK